MPHGKLEKIPYAPLGYLFVLTSLLPLILLIISHSIYCSHCAITVNPCKTDLRTLLLLGKPLTDKIILRRLSATQSDKDLHEIFMEDQKKLYLLCFAAQWLAKLGEK